LVSNLRRMMTKTGSYMSTFTVEEPSGRVNVIMFPRVFSQYGDVLAEDAVVVLGGKLDDKRGQYQIICDTAKTLSLEVMIENAKETGFYDPNDKSDIAIRLLDDILEEKEEESVAYDVESYKIEIPVGVAPEAMKSLKSLLLRNKGETPVEIHLKDVDRKINLDFGVSLNDDLKSEIDKLLIKS